MFSQVTKPEKINNEVDLLQTKKLNISIGLGASSIGFPMYYSNVSFQYKKNIYAVRYVKSKEVLKESLVLFSHAEPFEEIAEYGLTYGFEQRIANRIFIQMEGGVGYINGILRGNYISTKSTLFGDIKDYERIRVSSFSLLLNGTVFYKINKSFSLGSMNTINFNKHEILLSSSIVLKYCLNINKQSFKEVENP